MSTPDLLKIVLITLQCFLVRALIGQIIVSDNKQTYLVKIFSKTSEEPASSVQILASFRQLSHRKSGINNQATLREITRT
jgi:uncharacterized membrane protein